MKASISAHPNAWESGYGQFWQKLVKWWEFEKERPETHFFRTSPNSGAPVTPTTRYVPFSSLIQATTNGRLLTVFPFFASFSAHLSLVASTSQSANRDSVDGCENNRRSGPSRIVQNRNVRSGRIAAFSSKEEPCRMMERWRAIARDNEWRSKETLSIVSRLNRCLSCLRLKGNVASRSIEIDSLC